VLQQHPKKLAPVVDTAIPIMASPLPQKPRRVLIVGGGASGLVTLRNLVDRGEFAEVVLVERRNNVGGVWSVTASLTTHPPAHLTHTTGIERKSESPIPGVRHVHFGPPRRTPASWATSSQNTSLSHTIRSLLRNRRCIHFLHSKKRTRTSAISLRPFSRVGIFGCLSKLYGSMSYQEVEVGG
jgi:hypothetical protein